MTRTDFKPVYAEGNPEWRIRYQCNGRWELQEYRKLPVGVDRSREQPWVTHNRNMAYDDAIVRLAGYAKRKA